MSEPVGAVVTVGEALVALDAGESRVEDAPSLALHVVGAELNYAVGLVRLGVPARFLGAVGADPFGRRVLRAARAEGVDVAGVESDPERPTGLMVKDLPGLDGEPSVLYLRRGSAGGFYRGGARLSEALVGARGFHVTGISLCRQDGLDQAAAQLLEEGRQLEWRSFDLNVRLRLGRPERWREILAYALPRTATFFATEEEVRALGLEAEELAGLAARHGTVLVLRRGRRPTEIRTPDGAVERVEPVYARRPVSPFGAGDAFAAAVTAWRLGGASWREAVEAGHLAGAMAARTGGDFEGAPYREELEALLRGPALQR